MISLKKPKLLSCSTSVSEKPVSSMRFAPMTVETRKAETAAQRNRPSLVEQRGHGVVRRERDRAVEIEGGAKVRHVGGLE